MSVSSMGGEWGFGPQVGKGSDATTFYRFRVLSVQGGANDLTEPMPPEISGVPMVDGAHKLGTFFANQVDLIPRLENDFGWLLYAICGNVSTIADTPEAGLNTHIFRMDPSNMLGLKWVTVRSITPAAEGGAESGTQGNDVRIANMIANFVAAARFTARVAMVGREPKFSDNVTGWTWADEPEGYESVATSINTVGGWWMPAWQVNKLPTQSVRVTLGNQLTTPQQEFILGSPFPDDLIGLYRNMVIEAVYKWEDEDLYLQLAANGGTGAEIDWDPAIYESSVVIKVASDADIPGHSNPYSIEIDAPRVIWYPSAPPAMAGLNLIQLPVTGIVARPTDGSDPWQIRLVNEAAGYTWPV